MLPEIVIAATAAMPNATPVALPPSSKWEVGHDERDCYLVRKFGSANNETTLILRPYIGASKEQIILLLPERDVQDSQSGKATIVAMPSGSAFAASFVAGPIGGSTRSYAMNFFVETTGLRQALAASREMVVKTSGSSTALELTDVDDGLQSLSKCGDDLLRSWNVDPAKLIDLTEPAPMASWFSPNSYPPAALARKATGKVTVAIEVDERGKPRSCRVVVSSADADLDSGTCNILMKRAAYPRSTGQPLRYAVTSVTWSLD